MSGFLDHLLDRLSGRGKTVRARKPEPFSGESAADLEFENEELVAAPPRMENAGRGDTPSKPAAPPAVRAQETLPPHSPPSAQSPSPPSDASPPSARPEFVPPRGDNGDEGRAAAPVRRTEAFERPPATPARVPEAEPGRQTRETRIETRSEVQEVTRLDEVTITDVREVTVIDPELRGAGHDLAPGPAPATGEPAVPRQEEPARPILTRPPAAPESAADRTPGVAVASAEAVEPESDPGAPLPVRIEIGRVEIHAARSSEPARTPRPATTRRSAAMSLEAYLASKGGQT